jgi:hypothetical protein
MAEPIDAYHTLGVRRRASPDDIRKTFRKLSRKHHPDKGGDSATQAAIQAAYDVLMDADQRATLDGQLAAADGRRVPVHLGTIVVTLEQLCVGASLPLGTEEELQRNCVPSGSRVTLEPGETTPARKVLHGLVARAAYCNGDVEVAIQLESQACRAARLQVKAVRV